MSFSGEQGIPDEEFESVAAAGAPTIRIIKPYADEEKTEIALCAEVCYPHGYTNEIYSIVHYDVFETYNINNGKSFIEPIDEYVKKALEE